MILAAWLALMLWVVLVHHRTPLYAAESDTIGEYIPAAQELRRGVLDPAHYNSKGFGYPLALAAAGAVVRDDFLAARLLNVFAGAAGAAFTFLLFRAFLGSAVGVGVLLGLLVTPAFARATIDAATDVPTFALLVAATFLVLHPRRPWMLFAAGFVAGLATITRTNSVFLPAAAVVVLLARPPRLQRLGLYLAGLVIPLGAWLVTAHAIGASVFGNQNLKNVAFEIYGRGLTIEQFWAANERHFHSFLDLVTRQPVVFALRLLQNLGTRWIVDARELVAPWWGVVALPGLAFGWWRRPGWRSMALHAVLCYATLAPVFYLPRFGLYLIPFYLSGMIAVLVGARGSARPLAWGVLVVVLGFTGWVAAGSAHQLLATAPHETREAAVELRALGRAGDRLMARKPNVPYLAGMQFVPLPANIASYPEFLARARADHVKWLFVSPAERNSAPVLLALVDPGVVLPGLRQVSHRLLDPTHYYALYEFVPDSSTAAEQSEAYLGQVRRFVERRPTLALARTYLAGQLIERGRDREALEQLEVANRLAPGDLMTARMQVEALGRLGDWDAVVAACERAIRAGARTGWERSQIGRARLQQGRVAEAVAALRDARRIEPTNAQYAYQLGLVFLASGDPAAAVPEFTSALVLDPGHDAARLECARAWKRLGDPARALQVLGTPADSASRALADSLRAG